MCTTLRGRKTNTLRAARDGVDENQMVEGQPNEARVSSRERKGEDGIDQAVEKRMFGGREIRRMVDCSRR